MALLDKGTVRLVAIANERNNSDNEDTDDSEAELGAIVTCSMDTQSGEVWYTHIAIIQLQKRRRENQTRFASLGRDVLRESTNCIAFRTISSLVV